MNEYLEKYKEMKLFVEENFIFKDDPYYKRFDLFRKKVLELRIEDFEKNTSIIMTLIDLWSKEFDFLKKHLIF